MHSYPQKFLIRISLALVATAIVAYMAYDLLRKPVSISEPPTVLNEQIPELPETENALRNAKKINSILKSPFEPAKRETLDPGLFPSKDNGSLSFVQIEPTLIMTSEKNNFAVINNKIYKQGDSLPDGREIALITEKGLFLSTEKDKQFIAWKNPKQVLLVQEPSSKPQKEDAQASSAVQDKKETENSGENMTGKEIEALLQKLKTDGIEND
jgi:hypothetical protein